ncbi:unnamed protein product [Adineta ricciae]|uniref:Uncharacterized protein n=1 Tax=Adineta ricciae TaxID=249248 RepID=A0A815QRR2_ADIRI|nr:unnamed protein product [Adineta ricciae]
MDATDKLDESKITFDDSSCILFPYPFIFRDRNELTKYISDDLKTNQIVYNTKLLLGLLTLVLPTLNMFMIYHSVIHQQEDFADTYSTFHSIIYYGEFTLVHLLLFGTFVRFLCNIYKAKKSLCASKGEWVNLLDTEFTLMAFNMIKLIPIVSLNGFNIISKEISISVSVFSNYSRPKRIISFTILTLIIFIELITLISTLFLLTLVKVYQISFVGHVSDPSEWTSDQWLLFIGFAANIINITDTPTISQLSSMWDLTNKTWSNDVKLWFVDDQAAERKSYVIDQICKAFGFIKTFLWVRTVTANDLHCLVRLPPSEQLELQKKQ